MKKNKKIKNLKFDQKFSYDKMELNINKSRLDTIQT